MDLHVDVSSTHSSVYLHLVAVDSVCVSTNSGEPCIVIILATFKISIAILELLVTLLLIVSERIRPGMYYRHTFFCRHAVMLACCVLWTGAGEITGTWLSIFMSQTQWVRTSINSTCPARHHIVIGRGYHLTLGGSYAYSVSKLYKENQINKWVSAGLWFIRYSIFLIRYFVIMYIIMAASACFEPPYCYFFYTISILLSCSFAKIKQTV